jgi:futalosine hydrolase
MKLSNLWINAELHQMKIVLATATEIEMIHFRDACKESKMVELEYCITGVGLIATTFHLQKTILAVKPDLIIQIGLAGSFTTSYSVGSAVAVKNEIIADMGVFEKDGYKDIFDLGLENSDGFPYVKGQLINNDASLLNGTGLDSVNAVSVNEVSTSSEKINLYANRYHASIETMEGAALHYVCLHHRTRFIQIRGISNYIGERDKSKWEIKKAMNAASAGYNNLITHLENNFRK